MQLLEAADVLPDTYGLPEYFISEVVPEIDGPNVRIVCGVKRGGTVHWLCSLVMRADRLLTNNRKVAAVVAEALTICELFGAGRGAGH